MLLPCGCSKSGGAICADSERLTAGIVLAGEKTPRGWATGKAAKFDAYDAKAEVLALLAAAGVATDGLMVMGEAGDHYHPGQSATLRMGPKNVLAAFGTLHPATAKAFDLDGTVIAAEIFLDAIPAKKGAGFMRPAYTPPALQAVTRDFAFLVPDSTGGRRSGPRDQRLRQGQYRRCPPVRPFCRTGCARRSGQPGHRGDAAAGRQELYRRGSESDFRSRCGHRRQTGRDPARLKPPRYSFRATKKAGAQTPAFPFHSWERVGSEIRTLRQP